MLQVRRDEEWQPSAYFSRQLRGAEQRYSATELEALVLVETITHFGHYLYGLEFTAFTDHKPLEQVMSSTRLNPRLASFPSSCSTGWSPSFTCRVNSTRWQTLYRGRRRQASHHKKSHRHISFKGCLLPGTSISRWGMWMERLHMKTGRSRKSPERVELMKYACA